MELNYREVKRSVDLGLTYGVCVCVCVCSLALLYGGLVGAIEWDAVSGS